MFRDQLQHVFAQVFGDDFHKRHFCPRRVFLGQLLLGNDIAGNDNVLERFFIRPLGIQ